MNKLENRWVVLLVGALAAGLALSPFRAGAAERKFKTKGCADCHQKAVEKFKEAKFAHAAVKDQKCEACHLRHGTVGKLLLKQQGNALCYSCHKRDAIGMDKPVVHKVLRSGSCTQCHDPHGSQAPHLLKAEGAEACFGCHAREPFQRKTVHAVLKSGCASCHAAHASSVPNLLVADQAKLCAQCHASNGAFQKAHGGYPVTTCTGCHDPHSSDGPKLLKPTVHNPVASQSCDACHVPAGSPKPFAVQATGFKLCETCHDAKDFSGKVQHAPVKKGECLSCHDPHASATRSWRARPARSSACAATSASPTRPPCRTSR